MTATRWLIVWSIAALIFAVLTGVTATQRHTGPAPRVQTSEVPR